MGIEPARNLSENDCKKHEYITGTDQQGLLLARRKQLHREKKTKYPDKITRRNELQFDQPNRDLEGHFIIQIYEK
jgi:hypothetical protein